MDDVGFWTAIATGGTAIFTIILAIATAYLAYGTRQMVKEMKMSRLAQERPLVKVSIDHSRPYMLFVVVKNVGRTPALDINFGFSAPLINPSFSHPERDAPQEGFREVVLSEEVSFFAEGLNFLAPNDQVSVLWGTTGDIVEALRARGLEEKGIVVMTSYKSVSGERFENEKWTLNPVIHDELIWLMLNTPEMLMDKAAKLSDKISKAIDSKGRLKVLTADENKREGKELLDQPPVGWSKRRWKRQLLGRRRSWWRRMLGS